MTGALTWARLAYRQQRWELLLVAAGVGFTAIGMLWVASQLDGLRAASPECLPTPTEVVVACEQAATAYYRLVDLADILVLLSFGAPFGMGVLLGAPLVAREIDAGTAQLAWSIGRSRVWWLLRRIAFVALFALLALGLLAVASEILAAAINPDRNLQADFTWFGRRGWLIVARGVGALLLGMLVGAVIGRVLPAILAAALATAVAFTGLSFVMDRWYESEAVVERLDWSEADPVAFDPGAKYLTSGIETLDGAVYTWSDAVAKGIEVSYSDEQGRVYLSEADLQAGDVFGYDIQLMIPSQHYPAWVARDAALAGGLGLVALIGTGLIVTRRRPA